MTYKTNPRTDKPENAMLTEGHRKFLNSDESGYADSTQSDYYNAIARRVWNTYQDFNLLVEKLPDDERREIFDTEHGMSGDRELLVALMDTIAFMYDGVGGIPKFEYILESGVAKGEYGLHIGQEAAPVDVDLRVTYTQPLAEDLSEVVEAVQDRELGSLRRFELTALIRHMTVSDPQFDERLDTILDKLKDRDEDGVGWDGLSYADLPEPDDGSDRT